MRGKIILSVAAICFCMLFMQNRTVAQEFDIKDSGYEFVSLTPNIAVKDVNETVKFYTQNLGFKLIMSNPETGIYEWAMISNGGAVLMFQDIKSLQKEYPKPAKIRADSNMTFFVKVNNMHILYEKVKNTKHLVKEMHKTFYGTEEFAIRDNNGNILTIASQE